MGSKQAETNQREAEVARETAAAFGRAFTNGEVDAFLALLDAEVEYEAPSVMKHTVVKLKGHDEVRRYLEETTGKYESLSVEPKEIRDLGGCRFLMVGFWRAKPRETATPFGTPIAAVLDVRGRKVTRVRAFFDEQLAIDAAARD